MLQKQCAANRCQFLEQMYPTRLSQCTPAPPTGVARVTGQQAETSLTPVRSMARGVVSGPPVKVSLMSVKLYQPTCHLSSTYICPYTCLSRDLLPNTSSAKATKMDAEHAKHSYPLHILTIWPQSHFRHLHQYCGQNKTRTILLL